MLRDIALLSTPHLVAEDYGYDYEELQKLPHFKSQLAKVDAELFNEGHITRAMAEVGLSKAVGLMTKRVTEGAGKISNDDLNKFTNTLHKVTNRDKEKDPTSAKSGFSIEINLGGNTKPITINAKPIPTKKLDDEDEDEMADLDGVDSLSLPKSLFSGRLGKASNAGEIAVLDEIEVEELPDEYANYKSDDYGNED